MAGFNPSQEDDGANKKQRITGNNKNNIQPETKNGTCCCSWFLLPLPIVADILSRLPSKSIAKLRCVCKQWLSVTYDPDFLKLQHERSPSYIIIDKHVLGGEIRLHDFSTIRDGKESTEISCKIDLGRKYYRLSNFVNGLTCAYARGPKCDMYLLNPMTREHQKLPQNNSPREANIYEKFVLGIDMTMGQYKIVRLSSLGSHAQCEIYTVGTAQWRCLGDAPFDIWLAYNPVLLHGTLYWIARRNHQGEKLGLFRFNIKDEKFGSAISVPYPSLSHMFLDCLKESWGKLWLSFIYESYFEIWTMNDCLNNTWVKEYKFHRDNLSSLHTVYGLFEIVDGDILYRYYKSGEWHLISYNPCSGALHKLFLGGKQKGDFAFYRESLISPKAVEDRCRELGGGE